MAVTTNCSFGAPCQTNNISHKTFQPYYFYEDFPILMTKYTVLGMLVLFGFVGNIIVVLVTTKRKAFNSSLDLFVKTLAISDLGFVLLSTPVNAIRAELPFTWPLGEHFCIYVYPLLDLFFGTSVWTIAAIAIERYRNIVGMAHVHRRQTQTKRSAKVLVVFVWVFSFVVFCVPIYAKVVYVANPPTCTFQWTSDPTGSQELLAIKIWLGALVFLSYIFPVGIVIWTYVAISKQLNRSSTFLMDIKGIISKKTAKNRRQVETVKIDNDDQATLKGLSNGSFLRSKRNHVDNSRLTQNRRAKKILTPVAILLAISLFPVTMVRVLLIFWIEIHYEPYYRILFFITIGFACANSSLNPLVYCIVSREFRNAFKSLFFKIDRTHLRSSNGGFDHRESTDHRARTMEIECCYIENGVDEPAHENRNTSRLFLTCNTKL